MGAISLLGVFISPRRLWPLCVHGMGVGGRKERKDVKERVISNILRPESRGGLLES